MLKDVLIKYDRKLNYKKYHDGSTEIFRQSPYNTSREHYIFLIKGEYVGSGRWIREKLIKGDTQRFDIVGNIIRSNNKIKRGEMTTSRKISEEIGDFFSTGGDLFVNKYE